MAPEAESGKYQDRSALYYPSNALQFCCRARRLSLNRAAATTKGSEKAAAEPKPHQRSDHLHERGQQQLLVRRGSNFGNRSKIHHKHQMGG